MNPYTLKTTNFLYANTIDGVGLQLVHHYIIRFSKKKMFIISSHVKLERQVLVLHVFHVCS